MSPVKTELDVVAAIVKGDVKEVKELLGSGAWPDSVGDSPGKKTEEVDYKQAWISFRTKMIRARQRRPGNFG
jgi:hypothetical protein